MSVFGSRRLFGLALAGSLLSALSCSPPPKASETEANKSDHVFDVATDLEITGASLSRPGSIPVIQNHNTDVGDDFPETKVEKDEVVIWFNGILVKMVSDKDPGSTVTVTATDGTRSFSADAEVKPVLDKNKNPIGYLAYTDFENKFWLGVDDWSFSVSSDNHELFKGKTHLPQVIDMVFSKVSDNPFEADNERNLKTGVKYTYRFQGVGNPVAVLYRSEDWETFTPVAVLEPQQNGKIVDIGITWKTGSEGAYYITNYEKGGYPESVIKALLFDDRNVTAK
jgi:hypothetical protein